MSVGRITPETAFDAARGHVEELRAWAERDNVGKAVANLAMLEGLRTLDTFCEQPRLDVEVGVVSHPGPQALAAVVCWLAPTLVAQAGIAEQVATLPVHLHTEEAGWMIQAHLFSWEQPPRYKVGVVRPDVLIVVGAETALRDEQGFAALTALCQERPYVVLVQEHDDQLAPERLTALQQQVWRLEVYRLAALPDASLLTQLAGPGALQVLRAYALVRAAGGLSELFRRLIEQERSRVQVERVVTQQQVAKSQSQGFGGPTLPLSNRLRTLLQAQFIQCEQRLQAELEALLDTQQGELWQAVGGHMDDLTTLDKVPRVKNLEIRIPQAFLDKVLEDARCTVTQRYTAHLEAMQHCYQSVTVEVTAALQEAGVPPLEFHPHNLDTREDTQALIRRMQLDGEVYRGQSPKPSPMDFLTGTGSLRTMVMTLGMPLLSLATMFGVKTQETQQWRYYMGGGAAVLMVIGIAMKLWSLPKERAEAEQQDLDRAKSALRNALKQLFSTLQQAWPRRLSQHLKEAQEAIQSQLDAALQVHTERVNQAAAAARERPGGLDTMEKQLGDLLQKNRRLDSAVQQLQGDLRLMYLGLARPSPQVGERP
jgi:hypothetical protein